MHSARANAHVSIFGSHMIDFPLFNFQHSSASKSKLSILPAHSSTHGCWNKCRRALLRCPAGYCFVLLLCGRPSTLAMWCNWGVSPPSPLVLACSRGSRYRLPRRVGGSDSGTSRGDLVIVGLVGREASTHGRCRGDLVSPPPAPLNAAASPRGGRRARRGRMAAPALVGRLRGAAALAGAGGELFLPRLCDGSCFSRRWGGTLGEGGPAPALRLGGAAALAGAREELPLPPAPANEAASPWGGAVRSEREDGFPCSCGAAQRSSYSRRSRRRAVPPPAPRWKLFLLPVRRRARQGRTAVLLTATLCQSRGCSFQFCFPMKTHLL